MQLVNLNMILGEGMDEDENVTEETCPVAVNPEAIRCFYPRKRGKPGTRLTFVDRGGFAVTESFDEVLRMVPPR